MIPRESCSRHDSAFTLPQEGHQTTRKNSCSPEASVPATIHSQCVLATHAVDRGLYLSVSWILVLGGPYNGIDKQAIERSLCSGEPHNTITLGLGFNIWILVDSEIYLPCSRPRQTLCVYISLPIKLAAYQPGVTCLFLWSLPAL